MSQINRQNVEIWKMRFRRLYATSSETRAVLATLTDTWASDAAQQVTFTQMSVEGGTAGAVVTGNRLELLAAAEELLIDPLFLGGVTTPPSRSFIPDYSRCQP